MRLHQLPGGGTAARYSPGVYEWRGLVTAAALRELDDLEHLDLDHALGVRLDYWIRRPGAHYGTGRNAGQLKASAPRHPARAPDLDKLVRAVLDACTDAGVWPDDSRVVHLQATKRYDDEQRAGVEVQIWRLE